MKNKKLIIGVIILLFLISIIIFVSNKYFEDVDDTEKITEDDFFINKINLQIINKVNFSVEVFLKIDNVDLEPFFVNGDSITNTTINKTAGKHEIIVHYELNGNESMYMTNYNVDDYLQIIFEENGGMGGYHFKKE